MVNMQPGDQGNEFWYPQLPEGYEGNYSQSMPAYEAGGWQNGMNMGHYEMQRSPGWLDFQVKACQSFDQVADFQDREHQGFRQVVDFQDRVHQGFRQVVAFQDRGTRVSARWWLSRTGFTRVSARWRLSRKSAGSTASNFSAPSTYTGISEHSVICSRPRCNSRLSIPIHICLAFKKTRLLVLSSICRTQFCRGLEMAR